jgi:ElaB/YqjD/DUF883 family membrane-anchored ribosome-binding protein
MDAVVSRELKSLQEELSTTQRVPPPPSATAGDGPATAHVSTPDNAEARELREQIRDLMNEATTFFEEAERNIAAHPTESVVGALLVGILIGRLLGRH